MKNLFLIFSSVFFIILTISACTKKSQNINTKKKQPHIFVSILPQKYFVQRITGSAATVSVMVKPGHSPVTYEPLPDQTNSLINADIYFSIGVPFEKSWLPRLKKNSKNTLFIPMYQAPLKDQHHEAHEDCPNYAKHHDENKQKKDHHHHHHAGDPHVWMDPLKVKKMAEVILEKVIEKFPENREIFKKNYKKFIYDLDKLHNYIRKKLTGKSQKTFLVFHPSFGHFAKRYNLTQIAMEVDGKEPSAAQMSQIVSLAKNKNVKTIFIQKQFSTKVAQKIGQTLHINVAAIDPLDKDYIKNMKHIADTLSGAL